MMEKQLKARICTQQISTYQLFWRSGWRARPLTWTCCRCLCLAGEGECQSCQDLVPAAAGHAGNCFISWLIQLYTYRRASPSHVDLLLFKLPVLSCNMLINTLFLPVSNANFSSVQLPQQFHCKGVFTKANRHSKVSSWALQDMEINSLPPSLLLSSHPICCP